VTSSHTVSSSIGIGLGIPPYAVESVLGVVKAYTTRVGQGPFPTEDEGLLGARLRDAGAEFGSTTGRPRRCGSFDAALVRYAARINGAREMIVTKLDVLSGIDPLKIATAYETGDEFDPFTAGSLTPRYTEVRGFTQDISAARSLEDLPAAARDYLRAIQDHTGLKIAYVSIGPARDAVIGM
jgi:adenylosuccinate synthase